MVRLTAAILQRICPDIKEVTSNIPLVALSISPAKRPFSRPITQTHKSVMAKKEPHGAILDASQFSPYG